MSAISAATYWRRRATALVVGITVLTLLAWAASGALGGGRAPGQPTHGRGPAAPAGKHRTGHGPAGGRSSRSQANHAVGTKAKLRAGSGHQTKSALGSVVSDLGSQQQGNGQASPLPAGSATSQGSPPPACGRSAVVLTLYSPRYWYRPGNLPRFVVNAVSRASSPCIFNLGIRFMSVVVASGHTTIWNSATCVRRIGSRPVVLRRGVPSVFSVTWNRRTTPSGCHGSGNPVRAGTYTAAAFDDHLRTETMIFVLGGRGVAVP